MAAPHFSALLTTHHSGYGIGPQSHRNLGAQAVVSKGQVSSRRVTGLGTLTILGEEIDLIFRQVGSPDSLLKHIQDRITHRQ